MTFEEALAILAEKKRKENAVIKTKTAAPVKRNSGSSKKAELVERTIRQSPVSETKWVKKGQTAPVEYVEKTYPEDGSWAPIRPKSASQILSDMNYQPEFVLKFTQGELEDLETFIEKIPALAELFEADILTDTAEAAMVRRVCALTAVFTEKITVARINEKAVRDDLTKDAVKTRRIPK